MTQDTVQRLDRAARRRRAQAGFTLTELMVTILIIGLLATVVTINVLPMISNARVTKVKGDLSSLETAVVDYYRVMGSYPSTQDGLGALVEVPVGHRRAEAYPPNGFIRRLPSDPWGNDYQFIRPGRSGEPYEIFSFGADGVPGGEGDDADITLDSLEQS